MAVWEGTTMDKDCQDKFNVVMAAQGLNNFEFCVAFDRSGEGAVFVPIGKHAYEYHTPTAMTSMTILAEIPIMLRVMQLDSGEIVIGWCSGGSKPRWWASGDEMALKASGIAIIEEEKVVSHSTNHAAPLTFS
jgi:hypothetical protein